MESLLEVVQMEQHIYNTVFHEVIRQVTVSCAERGQLLAKLRLASMLKAPPGPSRFISKQSLEPERFFGGGSQLFILSPDSATSRSWRESPAV